MRNVRFLVAVVMAGMAAGVSGRGAVPGGETGKGLTMEQARVAVERLALRSANPYVREMVSHEHDGDWTIDVAAGKFSVKIQEGGGKVVTGKFTPAERGGEALFDDDAGLSRGWDVPAETVLTAEEAVKCLTAMGQRLAEPDPYSPSSPNYIKGLVTGLKNVEFDTVSVAGQMTGKRESANRSAVEWRIHLTERTFTIHSSVPGADTASIREFTGQFGWDKEHHWMAWPVEMSRGTAFANTGSVSGTGWEPVIPELNYSILAMPVASSSALKEHGADLAKDGDLSTFWQPAADDAHPTWTVDLKESVTITSVRMGFSGEAGLRSPVIDVSEDQKVWRTVEMPAAGRGRGGGTRGGTTRGPNPTTTVKIPADTTARYVRLTFPATGTMSPAPAFGGRAPVETGTTLQLTEVSVDGTVKSK